MDRTVQPMDTVVQLLYLASPTPAPPPLFSHSMDTPGSQSHQTFTFVNYILTLVDSRAILCQSVAILFPRCLSTFLIMLIW